MSKQSMPEQPARTLSVTGEVTHQDGGGDAAYDLIGTDWTPEEFCGALLDMLNLKWWMLRRGKELPLCELTLTIQIKVNR